MPGDKTPFCPFTLLPSLLCGSVMIAGVLGIHANNEFSRATFLFFFFFLFFSPLVVISEKNNLSNNFYSTLEEEERQKEGEEPFLWF